MERIKQLKQSLEREIRNDVQHAVISFAWVTIMISAYLLIAR
jgi:hypothetical protein